MNGSRLGILLNIKDFRQGVRQEASKLGEVLGKFKGSQLCGHRASDDLLAQGNAVHPKRDGFYYLERRNTVGSSTPHLTVCSQQRKILHVPTMGLTVTDIFMHSNCACCASSAGRTRSLY